MGFQKKKNLHIGPSYTIPRRTTVYSVRIHGTAHPWKCLFPSNKTTNSVVWVSERTIPTKRPPLVCEVGANSVPLGQRDSSLRSYSRFSRPEPLLFLSSSSSVVLKKLSGPRSKPTTSQKIWQRRESNPDLWICSQELWPLDHRGGRLFPSNELTCQSCKCNFAIVFFKGCGHLVIFFVILFYLLFVLVYSANCVKTCILVHVYSGM
jgi:hypothetical protein